MEEEADAMEEEFLSSSLSQVTLTQGKSIFLVILFFQIIFLELSFRLFFLEHFFVTNSIIRK